MSAEFDPRYGWPDQRRPPLSPLWQNPWLLGAGGFLAVAAVFFVIIWIVLRDKKCDTDGRDEEPTPTAKSADATNPPANPRQPVAASRSASPAAVELKLGQPIDLMRKFDVTQHTTRGNARTQNWELFTTANGATQVMIPFTPPDEYVLEAAVTRQEGEERLILVLIVGGRQVSLHVDGFPETGFLTGLSEIDGRKPDDVGYPGAHRGKLLTNGRESTIRCTVRRRSPQEHQVDVAVDGRPAFTWSGPASRLAHAQTFTIPNPQALSVGTWMAAYHVRKLELREILNASP